MTTPLQHPPFVVPKKVINTPQDLKAFLGSPSCRALLNYIQSLGELAETKPNSFIKDADLSQVCLYLTK